MTTSTIYRWIVQSTRVLQTPMVGYGVAILLPLATMLAGTRAGMPPFVFEHITVLFVVAVAIQWGVRPALLAALAASLGDNLLLREPIGRPTISGFRDVLDLGLFVIVAVTVGWLVASARAERMRAQHAAAREREAREQRDRLVATLTHDLATPLAAIQGTVQFARRFGQTSNLDLGRLMDRVDAAATRAISLVRTLNDVQTLDAGQLSLRMETADVRTLVTWVVHMLDRYSERHPIALAMPNEAVLVRCDVDRLRRVFENLVTNAIKYSPDGGAIEVSLCTEDRSAVVSVRDYGMGISPAAIPRIFERAYRAPEAMATAPGLGLGLSIAAEFVHRHGGTIEARAADPNGTTVTVRLPLASPSRHATDDVLRVPAATATQNVPTDVSQGGSGASPDI